MILVRTRITISELGFPYKIKNFPIRSRISISDLQFQYQIWNFHTRSRISIPNPKFPYQIRNFHIRFCCWLFMWRNHAIIQKIWLKKSRKIAPVLQPCASAPAGSGPAWLSNQPYIYIIIQSHLHCNYYNLWLRSPHYQQQCKVMRNSGPGAGAPGVHWGPGLNLPT